MILEIPYFGQIDTKLLNRSYRLSTEVKGQLISLDINFKAGNIDESRIVLLAEFLNNIDHIIATSWNAIQYDFENGSEVSEFLNFHFDELDEDDLKILLRTTDKSLSVEQQMLSVTEIKRIGFYPEEKEIFAILDFKLDEDISQYILVVNMKDDKTINYITMES